MRENKLNMVLRWCSGSFLPALVGLALAGSIALPLQAAERPKDADINYWVKDSLRNDQRVDASTIEVATNHGVVTLSGVVDSLAAKHYAQMEATKINGVVGLVDKIEVAPHFRSDSDIRYAVRRRILNSPVIDSEGIAVAVLDSRVTLRGTVASWSERDEAGLLASEVRGVKAVTNDITTRWSRTRPDQEIKNDAIGALKRDVYLAGLPITISVKDGVVTLEGTVGSLYEQERARTDVRWISNVKSIKSNLVIDPWKNQGARKVAPAPSDSELSSALIEELKLDPRVDDTGILVRTSYGHVTLDGTVTTHYEKRIAEQDARDTVGVGWVTNNLFARVDRREDWAIQGDVKFNLNTDFALEDFGLDVTVTNGTVSLSGTVHTWYQRSHAKDVASRVRGVRDVVNRIVVHRNTWKLDAELVEAIQSRLKWNWTTYWVHDDIGVTASSGVATLAGDVNTWAERREAGRVALETDGVWKVDNRLTVKGQDYPWDEWHYKGSRSHDPYNDSRDHDGYLDEAPYWGNDY